MKLKMLVIFLVSLFLTNGFMHGQSKPKGGDYYYKVGTYDRALRGYKRELRKSNNRAELYKKIVDCYIKSNVDKKDALNYLDKLLEEERNSETVFKHGQVLFYTMNFDLAMLEFEWVKLHEERDSELYKQSNLYLNWILNANAFVKKPIDVEFINLGNDINTSKSELNPYVSIKDDILLFSSNKRYSSVIGINYYNVCKSERDRNKWQNSKTLGRNINSQFDEIVAGCSPEGNPLFVFHNRNGNEKIGYSVLNDRNKYTYLEDYKYPIDQKGGEFGIWLSQSEDTLIFVRDNSEGNTDIFYSLKLPDGNYGEPRPIPGEVNSPYDENFPVLVDQGKRLYFSSNNEYSIGDYDLFYSDWNEETKAWGKPVNLGYPLNDVYDNYTISMPQNKRYAYVSAVRPEGYGERDIYKVLFKSETPDNLILRCNAVFATDTGVIVPNISMQAELKEAKENEVIGRYQLSRDSAKFVLAIEPGKYILTFLNNGKEIYKTNLDIPEMTYSTQPVNKEFIIPKNENVD